MSSRHWPIGGSIDHASRDEETRLDIVEKRALAVGKRPCTECAKWMDPDDGVIIDGELWHKDCYNNRQEDEE